MTRSQRNVLSRSIAFMAWPIVLLALIFGQSGVAFSQTEKQSAAPNPSQPADETKEQPTDQTDQVAGPEIRVKKCSDFKVDGKGTAKSWEIAEWNSLNRRPGGELDYTARFKMLYSETGVYFLFDGSDKTLTATKKEDFLHLWEEDVFECFLWTNEEDPIYFEYEISPLGYELPIIVPNLDGRFLGWRPWEYKGDRKVQRAVSVAGGKVESLSPISNWRAEVFIPFKLLEPLRNVPPVPGARWRANVYRVDYDGTKATEWDWARVGPSFHDFNKFGTVIFE